MFLTADDAAAEITEEDVRGAPGQLRRRLADAFPGAVVIDMAHTTSHHRPTDAPAILRALLFWDCTDQYCHHR